MPRLSPTNLEALTVVHSWLTGSLTHETFLLFQEVRKSNHGQKWRFWPDFGLLQPDWSCMVQNEVSFSSRPLQLSLLPPTENS